MSQGDAPQYVLPSRPAKSQRSSWVYLAIILVTAINLLGELAADDHARLLRFVALSLVAIVLAAFAWYECRRGGQ